MPVDSAAFLRSLHYELPDELIARRPPASRDGGRLLRVMESGLEDRAVVALPDLLQPGDLLVVNDTRVVPARLFATRASGGRVEVLLLPTTEVDGSMEALVRPGRRLKEGESLSLEGGAIDLVQRLADGSWQVRPRPSAAALMAAAGHMPLPPYLGRDDDADDWIRYQTVYAGPPGAVAAPTAGLHLSHEVLARLEARGIRRASVTLHVGPGTFRPLSPEDVAAGRLHREPWTVPAATAAEVARTRAEGGRVVAVGTTSTRVLEASAVQTGEVTAGTGTTDLFIRPGRPFAVVDRLLTNLHLPGSSLLALVQAFAGVARTADAYAHAVAARYRFYSYGDAMLLDLAPPGRAPEAP
ncbi:MAG: tRNA preQ1(34) S-adenosylmethionine ribosyltransferase-isomerase QueA [Alphaproteobacteria bacterium]|nr:tRNA preQ1(34) S-adenosylmethionine ribosyltransferase-isomerase QueA [Alphaproteobacteria bacterium]